MYCINSTLFIVHNLYSHNLHHCGSCFPSSLQMLSEGLKPNLITYNTLLEAYARQAKWEEALATLEMLQQEVTTRKGVQREAGVHMGWPYMQAGP